MSTQAIDGVFYVIVLIMSIVIHEYAHGYIAYRLGDNTAEMSGRLTLNPIKHLDPFGSVILPLLLVLTNAGFVIGWAKPVPYNPDNLRDRKWGTLYVALAGIVSNILLAVFFGLLIRFAPVFLGLPPYSLDGAVANLPFYKITTIIVIVNLVLALFNLVPVPPLDGSKVLFSFMPFKYRYIVNFLERWGMLIMLAFVLFLWVKVAPLISIAFSLITGAH
ncbi:MAG: site-2 protease family protein [bacterium]